VLSENEVEKPLWCSSCCLVIMTLLWLRGAVRPTKCHLVSLLLYIIVYCMHHCRVIIKQLTGGLWVFLFMKWLLDIRHSLPISRFKSMKRLFLERSVLIF